MTQEHRTASYRIIKGKLGNQYCFFCDLCGALLCRTHAYKAATPEEELELAWDTEGHLFFNHCHRCGRWVSNVMYNADELQCVRCAPWQAQQYFCTACGARLPADAPCCPICGHPVCKREGKI